MTRQLNTCNGLEKAVGLFAKGLEKAVPVDGQPKP